MKRNWLLAFVLSMTVVVALTVPRAFALSPVSYLDADGKRATCEKYTALQPANIGGSFVDRWYVVQGKVVFSGRINVSGTANVILCDGGTLNAASGISVPEGNTLNIWCQSGKSGTLNATGSEDCSGIGSNKKIKCGNINIYGGNVKAQGAKYGAGIGGGDQGNGGFVTIYDGTVIARGGKYGAGIGSGDEAKSSGKVLIHGGKVTAVGGDEAAGIGGGNEVCGAHVNIYGGYVEAYCSGEYGAGIGGGDEGNGDITGIYGGTVIATAGTGNTQAIGHGQDAGWTDSTEIGRYCKVKDSQGKEVQKDARVNTCYGHKVTVEPCNHNERMLYNPNRHQIQCTWCAGDGDWQAHEFDPETGKCVCGVSSYVVRFDPGEGSGKMDNAVVGIEGNFTLPNCSFTPPAGKKFYAWRIIPDEYYDEEKAKAKSVVTIHCNSTIEALYSGEVSYINEKGNEQTLLDYKSVKADESKWSAGWYVASGDVTVNSRVGVEGEVKLVLCDGAHLNVPKGISVTGKNSLKIFGQKGGTGVLAATGEGRKAGIGAEAKELTGKIQIYGGTVQAQGGSNAAGIGGGGENSTLTGLEIYGGTVSATGGSGGAGIGCYQGNGTVAGALVVRGGKIQAVGGANAPGIGGTSCGAAFIVNQYGGEVEAFGTGSGAGIGGKGICCEVINGKLKATGRVGISADGDYINLGGTGEGDQIYASSYSGIINLKTGFRCLEDSMGFPGGTGNNDAMAGRTLVPGVVVTFDDGNGGGGMAPLGVKKGGAVTLPECGFAAPQGQRFDSWLVNGKTMAVGDTVTVSSNTTATARWVAAEDQQAAPEAEQPEQAEPTEPVVTAEEPVTPETEVPAQADSSAPAETGSVFSREGAVSLGVACVVLLAGASGLYLVKRGRKSE